MLPGIAIRLTGLADNTLFMSELDLSSMGVAISPVIAGPLPRRNIDGTFTSEMP